VIAPSRKPKRQAPSAGTGKAAEPARNSSVRCPICGKPATREHRPFCSKRCAEIDLGRWLKGGYAVPGESIARIDSDKIDDDLD
jgi:endogenous inhibitor of DNA gyrase (YacG/DUF329 family)